MAKSKLVRTLITLTPNVAIAALVYAGMEHDDAVTAVQIGGLAIAALLRRWRARRRTDE